MSRAMVMNNGTAEVEAKPQVATVIFIATFYCKFASIYTLGGLVYLCGLVQEAGRSKVQMQIVGLTQNTPKYCNYFIFMPVFQLCKFSQNVKNLSENL